MINLDKSTVEIKQNTEKQRGQRRNIQNFNIIEHIVERKLLCKMCIHSVPTFNSVLPIALRSSLYKRSTSTLPVTLIYYLPFFAARVCRNRRLRLQKYETEQLLDYLKLSVNHTQHLLWLLMLSTFCHAV